MHSITLPRLGTFDAWRDAARRFAERDVDPAAITWEMEGAAASLFGDQSDALPDHAARQISVPKDFPPLAKQLCASRAPGVFDLGYRLLLRVSQTPALMRNRADPDMNRAEELAKNIRRDMHKMKAFVRFREVTPEGAARRQFVSWFEPDHRIEELIAGFFARRFGDMDWVIVTPEVTTRFESGKITQEAIPATRPNLTDETEALWQTYYANIFNPARLKIKAMQAEMPKKYWKNLPEAELIPGLIAQAEARVSEMQAAAPSLAPLRAGRVLDRLHQPRHAPIPGGIEGLRAELRGCARCPLARDATQAVPGKGPADAELMIVGEQPGDQEDLAGRPFVGPAGQLFDRLAAEAGLDRGSAYLTNAVKHFKFQVRGKRRIHQNPSAQEVSHCRWWLDQEIATVQPRLVVALGATAALALTGNGKNITRRRGTIKRGLHGGPVLLGLHPAALLRQPDPRARSMQEASFRDDIAMALAWLDETRDPPTVASA